MAYAIGKRLIFKKPNHFLVALIVALGLFFSLSVIQKNSNALPFFFSEYPTYSTNGRPYFDYTSESLVLNRLDFETLNISYDGFFQLWRVNGDKRAFGDFRTKKNYDPNFVSDVNYLADGYVYRSQIGAQAAFWSKVHKFLAPYHGDYSFTRKLNVLFISVVLTPIVLWISDKFGKKAGMASACFMAASTGIAIFSESLYWSIFLFFFPMALVCLHYEFYWFRLWHCSIILFFTFLFKFLSGYEFISTIVIMAIIPAIVELPSSGIQLTVKKTLIFFMLSLLAFVVGILIFDLTYFKSFQEVGILHILSRGESWSQLREFDFYISQVARIMLMNFLSIGHFGIPLSIFFLFFIVFIVYSWNKLLQHTKIFITVSAVASLSWFIIQPIHILFHPRYAPLILVPLGLSLVVGVAQLIPNTPARTS